MGLQANHADSEIHDSNERKTERNRKIIRISKKKRKRDKGIKYLRKLYKRQSASNQ